MNANDKRRLRESVIRSENTPQGFILPPAARRNSHAPVQEWAYNTTGYELKAGYIVAVTAYDPAKNQYTIVRPTADGMPNIAVVKSSIVAAGSGNRVELQFSGAATLWYSGTAPTVTDTVGSSKDSFNAKIGFNGFAPLGSGGGGRIRCRFFSGKEIFQVAAIDVSNPILSWDDIGVTNITSDKFPLLDPDTLEQTSILYDGKSEYLILYDGFTLGFSTSETRTTSSIDFASAVFWDDDDNVIYDLGGGTFGGGANCRNGTSTTETYGRCSFVPPRSPSVSPRYATQVSFSIVNALGTGELNFSTEFQPTISVLKL